MFLRAINLIWLSSFYILWLSKKQSRTNIYTTTKINHWRYSDWLYFLLFSNYFSIRKNTTQVYKLDYSTYGVISVLSKYQWHSFILGSNCGWKVMRIFTLIVHRKTQFHQYIFFIYLMFTNYLPPDHSFWASQICQKRWAINVARVIWISFWYRWRFRLTPLPLIRWLEWSYYYYEIGVWGRMRAGL